MLDCDGVRRTGAFEPTESAGAGKHPLVEAFRKIERGPAG